MIHGDYINTYISTHIFIEIKWLVDFRKDPYIINPLLPELFFRSFSGHSLR